jgi:hypothetical protein
MSTRPDHSRDGSPGVSHEHPPAVHDPGTAAGDPQVVALAAALAEEPMFVSRTLRSFVRDGRIETIPSRDRKRRVILLWLRETAFADPGPWSEPEVNMRLGLVNRDVSALRRYLVDAGLLAREGGIYRHGPS